MVAGLQVTELAVPVFVLVGALPDTGVEPILSACEPLCVRCHTRMPLL